MRGQKQFYLSRISDIQNFLKYKPSVHVNDITAALNQYPKGSISSTISLMCSTKHLKRLEEGTYALPMEMHHPKNVARDISDYKKKIKNRKKIELTNFDKTLFDKSTNDNLAIEQAIALVKKNGYRVYKSVTKLEEV